MKMRPVGHPWRKVTRAERVSAFKIRLQELGHATYGDYLRSEHWADVKRRFWASRLAKHCLGCGATSGLVLHHRTYKRLGAEHLGDLVLVCRDCHQDIHNIEDADSINLWGATNKALRRKRKAVRAQG